MTFILIPQETYSSGLGFMQYKKDICVCNNETAIFTWGLSNIDF